jgi:hypothetical protein
MTGHVWPSQFFADLGDTQLDLPAFLEKHALPSIEQTVPTESTVRDLLLSSTSTSTSQPTSTATQQP